MARRKFKSKAPSIKFRQARAERDQQIRLFQNFLHRPQPRYAPEREWMVGSDDALTGGGGEYRGLEQLGKLDDRRYFTANAGTDDDDRTQALPLPRDAKKNAVLSRRTAFARIVPD